MAAVIRRVLDSPVTVHLDGGDLEVELREDLPEYRASRAGLCPSSPAGLAAELGGGPACDQ